MNNYFNQDEDDGQDFRDIPDEVSGHDAGVPQVRVNRPIAPPQQAQQAPEPEVEYEEEQSDEEEDFSSLLSDARSRMEQGRLYEMLMDHDIFAGADADEKAIKFVTKQIRMFAKERMEIMLGMRQEPSKVQAFNAADFPFNDIEVAALKDLAYVATKGASSRDEAQTFTPQAAPAPRRTGLNPIAVKQAPKPAARPSAPPARAAAPAPKPLAQKAAAPVKRDPKTEAAIERILQEEGITREEYERQYPPGYKSLPKPLNNMNEQELAEWRRQDALKTNAQVKSNFAIPMPTAEQEEMLHTQRANTAAQNPQMQVLMAALTKKK
jgi:hypothetical protein